MAMFENIKINELGNSDLADAVSRARRLTSGSYSNYERNEESLSRLLPQIMKLSRQEKEWYLYFDALYNRIYLANRAGDTRTIVKYAEIYYRDSALYMDREIPNYPGTDLAEHNTWIYLYIRDAYESYWEIDDARMDSFMRQYEEAALKYGQAYWYYRGEMQLALLYRDEALMEHGKRGFDKYEKEMRSCYICGHLECLAYYIMKDRLESAEGLLLDYRNQRIPRQHRWCYQYCQNAETQSLYASVLEYSLNLGKTETFRYFLEKYWMEQPRECQRGEKERWYCNLSIYLCAITGNFDALESDLAVAREDMEKMETYSTVSRIKTCLQWYCYFILLDKSGVHEVDLCLPKTEDRISALEAGRYMERIADENGEKFSRARAKYDYALVKAAYLECAGLA